MSDARACWPHRRCRRPAARSPPSARCSPQRGGGCHQRFGATQIQVAGLGTLLYCARSGRATDRARAASCAGTPLPPPRAAAARLGRQRAARAAVEPICRCGVPLCARRLAAASAAFIAHRRALAERSMPSEINRCPPPLGAGHRDLVRAGRARRLDRGLRRRAGIRGAARHAGAPLLRCRRCAMAGAHARGGRRRAGATCRCSPPIVMCRARPAGAGRRPTRRMSTGTAARSSSAGAREVAAERSTPAVRARPPSTCGAPECGA